MISGKPIYIQYSHSDFTQEISQILQRRTTFPIQSPSLRPLICPKDLYQDPRCSGSSSSNTPHQITMLSRQHFNSIVSEPGKTRSVRDHSNPPVTRVFGEPGEEPVRPLSQYPPPACTDRFTQLSGLSVTRTSGQHISHIAQVRTLRSVPLALLSQLLGKMISCLAIVP